MKILRLLSLFVAAFIVLAFTVAEAAPLRAPAWKAPLQPSLSDIDQKYLSVELRQRLITDGDIPRLEKLANAGSLNAAYKLGMFQIGKSQGKQDGALEKAVEYFRLAAKNGSTLACIELAEIYVPMQRRNSLPLWDAKSAYIWMAIAISGPTSPNTTGLASDFEIDQAKDNLALLDEALLPSEKKEIEKSLKAWPKSMPPVFSLRTVSAPGTITQEIIDNAKAAEKSRDKEELCKWYGVMILRGNSEMEHYARKQLAKIAGDIPEAERNKAFAEAEKWHSAHPVTPEK